MTVVFLLAGTAGALVPVTVVVGVLEKHGLIRRRRWHGDPQQLPQAPLRQAIGNVR